MISYPPPVHEIDEVLHEKFLNLGWLTPTPPPHYWHVLHKMFSDLRWLIVTPSPSPLLIDILLHEKFLDLTNTQLG